MVQKQKKVMSYFSIFEKEKKLKIKFGIKEQSPRIPSHVNFSFKKEVLKKWYGQIKEVLALLENNTALLFMMKCMTTIQVAS